MKWTLLGALALFFASCGQQNFDSKLSSTRSSSSGVETNSCSCMKTENPVCGANGLTYTNSCFANCHGQNYTLGACVTTDCSKSGVVCGKPNTNCNQGEYCSGETNPAPQNYNNDCERIEQNAIFLHVGACTSSDV